MRKPSAIRPPQVVGLLPPTAFRTGTGREAGASSGTKGKVKSVTTKEKKVVCQNRRAAYDYFIDEVLEAGIVLLGPEVKSLREGQASLVDSYARVKQGEVFLYNMRITPYSHAQHVRLDPTRTR